MCACMRKTKEIIYFHSKHHYCNNINGISLKFKCLDDQRLPLCACMNADGAKKCWLQSTLAAKINAFER